LKGRAWRCIGGNCTVECVGASWNVMNTHDVNSGLIRVKVSKGVWEERSPDRLGWK